MFKKTAIIISPNWHDYAAKYLGDCIESIRRLDYKGEIKVYITDNETSPASVALLTRLVPEADIVCNKTNDGFAKGVNDSIRQALQGDAGYILVTSIHARLAPDCLIEMVKVLEERADAGVVQARQMLPDRETVLSLGDATHFLGFGYCLGYRQKWSEIAADHVDSEEIHYPSGASMLFKRETLERIGLLDEEYWMYNEDQEIGWRLWLAGYRPRLASRAVIYSDYEFQRSITKFYWMDRNRIISLLLCYKLPTLVLILPAFILMEFGHIFFSLKGGWFRDKMRVWGYFLEPRTWAYLYKARRRNQSLRQVPDRTIALQITGRIWYQEINDWKLRAINPVFDLYWRVCRLIMFW